MTSPFLMPHAVCWAADPRLIWTMVVANFVTFLSYLSLCITLLFIAKRTRRVIARDWIWFMVGFALFIVACGSTHLMDVVTTWKSVFWLDAWAVIVTAILSAYVALMLIRRAGHISYAINDYAVRLASTEEEKVALRDKLLVARKLEDWSRMSAAISHEIANPLESIQNILYLLETDDKAPPETVRLAEQARQEVGRVITISRSTLSFHRESASPEDVNLYSVAESVRFLLQDMILTKHIHFEIAGDPALTIHTFPGEVRQVVLNLARNACEAITRMNGTVTVRIQKSGAGIQLQVDDEGSGIDPAVANRLFEFGKTTKGERGNGMGLWTVRQIVMKHGGHIKLDQQYVRGARFTVWWPMLFESSSALESTTTVG